MSQHGFWSDLMSIIHSHSSVAKRDRLTALNIHKEQSKLGHTQEISTRYIRSRRELCKHNSLISGQCSTIRYDELF